MAITATYYNTTNTSNKRIVTATLTSTASGDTWATGLGEVDAVVVTPQTSASTNEYVTVSAGTLTITYTGASGVFYVIAIGA
jgi:hypothetical protein